MLRNQNEHIDEFDKIIKSKLLISEETPPEGNWENLDSRLHENDDYHFDNAIKEKVSEDALPSEGLWEKINKSTNTRSKKPLYWGAAAFIIIVGAFGLFFIEDFSLNNESEKNVSQLNTEINTDKKKEGLLQKNNNLSVSQKEVSKQHYEQITYAKKTKLGLVFNNLKEDGKSRTNGRYSLSKNRNVALEYSGRRKGEQNGKLISQELNSENDSSKKNSPIIGKELGAENRAKGFGIAFIDLDSVQDKSVHDEAIQNRDRINNSEDQNTQNQDSLANDEFTQQKDKVKKSLSQSLAKEKELPTHKNNLKQKLFKVDDLRELEDSIIGNNNQSDTTLLVDTSIASTDSLKFSLKDTTLNEELSNRKSTKKWRLAGYVNPTLNNFLVSKTEAFNYYFDSLNLSHISWNFGLDISLTIKENFLFGVGIKVNRYSYQYEKVKFGYEEFFPLNSSLEEGKINIKGLFSNTQINNTIGIGTALENDNEECACEKEIGYRERLKYMSVNIPFEVRWIPGSKKIRPIVKIGGEFILLAHSSSEIQITVPEGSASKENHVDMKRLNFAASFGFGTQINLTENLGLTLEPHIQYHPFHTFNNATYKLRQYSISFQSGLFYTF